MCNRHEESDELEDTGAESRTGRWKEWQANGGKRFASWQNEGNAKTGI
jgi:hypothetical protein